MTHYPGPKDRPHLRTVREAQTLSSFHIFFSKSRAAINTMLCETPPDHLKNGRRPLDAVRDTEGVDDLSALSKFANVATRVNRSCDVMIWGDFAASSGGDLIAFHCNASLTRATF